MGRWQEVYLVAKGETTPLMLPELTKEKSYIFRITHRDNLPWIFDHGLHCRNSSCVDPNFVSIGNDELIQKRHTRDVPISPFGTLSDYIPFYFTPLSMMAYNIKTGHNGITRRANEEIVILVSALVKLYENDAIFIYTNKHARVADAKFTSDINKLDWIDWGILQRRDFSRDNDDLEKTSRYQAEALVHKHIPIELLAGIACCNLEQKKHVESMAGDKNCNIKAVVKQGWYF